MINLFFPFHRIVLFNSALQTLKLSLMRAEADRDLCKKEKMKTSDKITHVANAFEGEIKV